MLSMTSHQIIVDVSIVQEKKATLASLIEAAAQKEQQMIKVRAPESDLRQEYDSLKEEKVFWLPFILTVKLSWLTCAHTPCSNLSSIRNKSRLPGMRQKYHTTSIWNTLLPTVGDNQSS